VPPQMKWREVLRSRIHEPRPVPGLCAPTPAAIPIAPLQQPETPQEAFEELNHAVTDTSGMQAVPVFLSTLRPYCFKPEVQVASGCAAVTDPLSQQVPGPPGAAAFTNVYARHCSCSEHALRHTS
jgi:hypothetical protein